MSEKVRRGSCLPAVCLCGDPTAAFWGCLFSSPLPPPSVSTSLGISETSHNKFCSVSKGADDEETDAPKQDGLSWLSERPPRLLPETAGTSQSANPGSEPPRRPAAPGRRVPCRQPPQPEATGPRNRTSFLRLGKPWLRPGRAGVGGAGRRGGGPRALRKVHRGGGGGRGTARPSSPASPCRFHH